MQILSKMINVIKDIDCALGLADITKSSPSANNKYNQGLETQTRRVNNSSNKEIMEIRKSTSNITLTLFKAPQFSLMVVISLRLGKDSGVHNKPPRQA